MADKSILFSPSMAAGVLTGRKTLTRRLLRDGCSLPYSPGDNICCRETHYRHGFWEPNLEGKPSKKPRWRFVGTDDLAIFEIPRFAALPIQGVPLSNHGVPTLYKRPARFMFKRHARLWLNVEECYSQRLHDAFSFDFEQEGIASHSNDGRFLRFGIPDRDGLPGQANVGWPWSDWQPSQKLAFIMLWDGIYGTGAYDSNPVVSVTRFSPVF
jgi:hypothetical protein